MKQLHTVAITGRSGSGKSLVTQHYAAKGYPTADGDEISRFVTTPGSRCVAELAAAFGPEVLAPDGSLLRGRLAELAFSSPEGAKRLVAITHPHIVAELLRRRDAAKEAGATLFFVDGAMIVGAPFEEYCDKIIVVVAEARLSVSRIILRDGISKTAALRRLAAQPPEEALLAAADYVIMNNEGEKALYKRADDILAQLTAMQNDE